MRNFCFDVKYATRLEKTIDENINKVQQSYKQYSECLMYHLNKTEDKKKLNVWMPHELTQKKG